MVAYRDSAKHYRDATGREVHGLALRSDGRFYAIKARNKTFGPCSHAAGSSGSGSPSRRAPS